MGTPYAELIGDPVAHSLSPAIHTGWLRALGLSGEYSATRVASAELASYFAARRVDTDWRGCNVTAPHKQAVIPLLDQISDEARAIGAVNCIAPGPDGLTGSNSDIEGVAAALASVDLTDCKVAMIGAGGAARAALHLFAQRGVKTVTLIVRDQGRAASLRRDNVETQLFAQADAAMAGARLIVNATPLGMASGPPMPALLLASLASHAEGAIAFDMVYRPLETEFLAIAGRNGAATVDGLTMLIGQARFAFRLFFGREAPEIDVLRAELSL
jgi:shikimate dehydrogenase